MSNFLKKISNEKMREVAELKADLLQQPQHAIHKILKGEVENLNKKSFINAFKKETFNIITEIKRRSPANGLLSDIRDPIALAKQYVEGGATAISVLTDRHSFSGSFKDLEIVSNELNETPCPFLCKDFIIDEVQFAKAAFHGANAVLLIVALLQENTKPLLQKAHQFGLDALVEIHDEDELQIALDAGAKIIGVNNRNLNTLEVNIFHSLALSQHLPNDVVKISESGIKTKAESKLLYDAGFNAILVGEALVKSSSPKQLIKELKDV